MWLSGDQRSPVKVEQTNAASPQEAEQHAMPLSQEVTKNGAEGTEVKEEDVKDKEEGGDQQHGPGGDEDLQQGVKEETSQESENQPAPATENIAASDEVAMETGDANLDVPSAPAEEAQQERTEVEQDQQESAPRDNGQAERMEASEERPGQWSCFELLYSGKILMEKNIC